MRENLEKIKHELLYQQELKLPYQIYININKLSDKELQEETGLFIKPIEIREYIYIYLSKYTKSIIHYLTHKEEIDSKDNNKGMLEITEKHTTIEKLREYGRTTKNIYHKQKEIKPFIIKFLVKKKIIIQTKSAINLFTKNKYKLSHTQNRAFILNKELISDPITIDLETLKPIKIQQRYIRERINYIINSDSQIAKTQLIMNTKFSKLDRQFIREQGKLLIGSNYKGKLFTEETLRIHMIIFDYLITNSLIIPTISIKSGRVFTSFNKIPGWMRNYLTIDGEKTTSIDIKSSIPSILNTLYGGNKVEYEYIVDKYDIEYSVAKIEVLEFLFSTNHKNKRDKRMHKICSYFKETNKELLDFMINFKKVKDKNKIFANILFKYESDMFEEIISELRKLNIYTYYVFDELVCKEKDQYVVEMIMKDYLKKYKIKTIVK